MEISLLKSDDNKISLFIESIIQSIQQKIIQLKHRLGKEEKREGEIEVKNISDKRLLKKAAGHKKYITYLEEKKKKRAPIRKIKPTIKKVSKKREKEKRNLYTSCNDTGDIRSSLIFKGGEKKNY